jgi:tetratricopeptide (TPR) repeat protein
MPKLPNQESLNPQFPSISRFIPEKIQGIWYPKLFLVSFVSGLLVLGIVLQAHTLVSNVNQLRQQEQQRIQINREIEYWKGIVGKYQGYGDAYLKLASLEYKLGNTIEAKQYIDKAYAVDPNSKEGKVLGAKIHLQFQ